MRMETKSYKENTNNTINFLFDKERKMIQKIILYPAMLFFLSKQAVLDISNEQLYGRALV